MGAKLKKVHTVDKSGPLIAGKVGGSGADSAGANSSSSPSGGYRRPSAANGGGGAAIGAGGPGAPKLGGIFEGLASMPKLKPVGSRGKWPSRQFVIQPKKKPHQSGRVCAPSPAMNEIDIAI